MTFLLEDKKSESRIEQSSEAKLAVDVIVCLENMAVSIMVRKQSAPVSVPQSGGSTGAPKVSANWEAFIGRRTQVRQPSNPRLRLRVATGCPPAGFVPHRGTARSGKSLPRIPPPGRSSPRLVTCPPPASNRRRVAAIRSRTSLAFPCPWLR